MLLDQKNPYRPQLPQVLELTWEDFECRLSDCNEAAIGKIAEWTVMAYMAADNNLAEWMFDDLLELKSIGSGTSIHVCALFDGPLLTDSFFARLNVGTPLAEDVLFRFNELISSDDQTLKMALGNADSFPAKRRLLFLCGHGNGAKGALLDENIGMQQYSQSERLVLPGNGADCDARLQHCRQQVQDQINDKRGGIDFSTKQPYDVMAFDACYMGALEVIASLAKFADILVVSEDVAPGEGYDYRQVLEYLSGNPTQSPTELAQHLLKSGDHVTQIALASSHLPGFANAFVRLVEVLNSALQDAGVFLAVRNAMEKAFAFEATDTIDLKGFVLNLLQHSLPSEIKRAALAVLESWSALVLLARATGTPEGPNGLSIYGPSPQDFDIGYLARSSQLPFNLGMWTRFLAAYYLQILRIESPGHPLIEKLLGCAQRPAT